MCSKNFRIRLDLCKFYNDVRRLCWIFIDTTKMLQISHMKERITELFNISGPFHLLLNQTEYLPPNEDIRILKENETILVCPGYGLKIELDLDISNISLSEDRSRPRENSPMALENTYERCSVQHKESQINLPPRLGSPLLDVALNDITSRSQNGWEILIEERTYSKVPIASTEVENSETSSTSGTKTVDTILTEESRAENTMAHPKRKRTRRGKRNPGSKLRQPATTTEENQSKKPKIINSCTITIGKHIRFDNADVEQIVEVARPETTNGINIIEVSPSHELSNLLSLGKSSTPLTFTNTSIKEEIKAEHVSDEETELTVVSESVNENGPLITKLEKCGELLDKNLEACPIMKTQPQLRDIIAFKMLKIGSDFTPQVSEFIIGEVISCSPTSSVYTFKIIEGLTEVQVPVGKFTIVEELNERVLNDTITLNIAQIMEPRLIATCDPDRTVTPVNRV